MVGNNTIVTSGVSTVFKGRGGSSLFHVWSSGGRLLKPTVVSLILGTWKIDGDCHYSNVEKRPTL